MHTELAREACRQPPKTCTGLLVVPDLGRVWPVSVPFRSNTTARGGTLAGTVGGQ